MQGRSGAAPVERWGVFTLLKRKYQGLQGGDNLVCWIVAKEA